MSEELVVTKREVTDEVIITKKPVTETKTEQVRLMHEEIKIERRPASNSKIVLVIVQQKKIYLQ